jgi:hypothetical protein
MQQALALQAQHHAVSHDILLALVSQDHNINISSGAVWFTKGKLECAFCKFCKQPTIKFSIAVGCLSQLKFVV